MEKQYKLSSFCWVEVSVPRTKMKDYVLLVFVVSNIVVSIKNNFILFSFFSILPIFKTKVHCHDRYLLVKY